MKNYCGIDVGCTNIKMVAVLNNKPHHKTVPSRDNLSRKELIQIICNFYKSFQTNFSVLGIAFSGYTFDSLTVAHSTLPCLKGLSVTDFQHLKCDNIFLINDSNATALSGLTEYPNSKVLIGITNGTGIGCGIAINGSLFSGSNGLAGEIYGNTIYTANGDITKIGRICSGSKILKTLSSNPDTVKQASINLGNLLVSIIHLYNPDTLYFSGGGFLFDDYLNLSIAYAKENVYPNFLKNLIFVRDSYNGYSGCFGAIKFVQMKSIKDKEV